MDWEGFLNQRHPRTHSPALVPEFFLTISPALVWWWQLFKQKNYTKEVSMKNSVLKLQNFLSDSFNSKEDEEIWKKWAHFKVRERKDLIALLASEVRDQFKKQALAVSLVPDFQLLPVAWPDRDYASNFLSFNKIIEPEELSESLRLFAMQLLQLCVSVARDSEDDTIRSTLYVYNTYVIQFLKILPEDSPEAETVFNCYELRDPVVFYNPDDCSGYNPLYQILNEKQLSEKWKWRASEKMHEIILEEQSGKRKPRRKYEDALYCYTDQIQLPLNGTDGIIRYGTALFAFQLEFLLALPAIHKNSFLRQYNLLKILTILSEDVHRELRHRLAQHMVFRKNEKFEINSSESMKAAYKMIDDFSSDSQLTFVLTDSLVNFSGKKEQHEATAKNKLREEEKILAQMRQ
jgi:hypothetical protein